MSDSTRAKTTTEPETPPMEASERRRGTGDFRGRPQASPASMVVFMVSGVLLVSGVAAAFLGGGFGDETPHGRLLTTLQEVAEIQERHYGSTGQFMDWQETPPADVPADVELQLVSGGGDHWRALARAPEVGLVCSQAGSVIGGEVVRERPICFREEP